jgi:acetyl esterase
MIVADRVMTPEDFDLLRERRFAKLSLAKQEYFRKAPGAGFREMGLDKIRALGNSLMAGAPAIAEGVTTSDVNVPGPNGPIPMRIYRPTGAAPMGAHFHIHAGGYIMLGGLGTESTRLSNLAREVGCLVVAPDFRLPPEHKFPIGIEDCWAALQWTSINIAAHGGDPSRIGVGGGCTGGVFSAVMALKAREAGLSLRYLYMIATVTDTREQYRSYYEFANGYTLTRDTANYVTSLYLRDDLDRFDWRASPVLVQTVKGLPRTLVVEGEWDVLHDEAQVWANRLTDAGVDVTFREFKEEGHSFSTESSVVAQKEFYEFVRQSLT